MRYHEPYHRIFGFVGVNIVESTLGRRGRDGGVCRRSAYESNLSRVFFATCARGLGEVLADELREIGGTRIVDVVPSGVRFETDTLGDGCRAAFWVRTAMRIVEEVAAGQNAVDDVYGFAREAVRWGEEVVLPGQTFSVDVRASPRESSVVNGIRMRVKDAVCDAMRDRPGGRKPIPPDSPALADVPLFITVNNGTVSIHRDLAGPSLHKRGYRRNVIHKSALNESVAAGMLLLGGWKTLACETEGLLVDPVCGSGTLLIEATLIALNIAPGLFRDRFAFQSWSDVRAGLIEELREEALAMRLEHCPRILGNDTHAGALSIALQDIASAGLETRIELDSVDVEHLHVSQTPMLVVGNPPWGRRLDDAQECWSKLGIFLKREASGSRALLFSGSSDITQYLKMKASSRYPIRIGNVDCRVLDYQIFPSKGTLVRSEAL